MDDPLSPEDVKVVVQALFNQAGKQTAQSQGIPRSPTIISANFACAKDKRIFSRLALLLFEKPNPLLSNVDMEKKKSELDISCKTANRSILESLYVVEKFLHHNSRESRVAVSERREELLECHVRSIDTYSNLIWFALEVLKLVGMEGEEGHIWDYMETKLSPFVQGLYVDAKPKFQHPGQNQLSNLENGNSFGPLLDAVKMKIPQLQKKQVSNILKLTDVDGKNCVAFSYTKLPGVLGGNWKVNKIRDILTKVPGSKKGPLHFLSLESELDYFRNVKGRDIEGTSEFKQSVCLPHSQVPGLPEIIVAAINRGHMQVGKKSLTTQKKVDQYLHQTTKKVTGEEMSDCGEMTGDEESENGGNIEDDEEMTEDYELGKNGGKNGIGEIREAGQELQNRGKYDEKMSEDDGEVSEDDGEVSEDDGEVSEDGGEVSEDDGEVSEDDEEMIEDDDSLNFKGTKQAVHPQSKNPSTNINAKKGK